MALDRNNRETAYVAGRMIAITQHYAAKHFGPGTLTNMFTCPAFYVDAFRRYIDTNDDYYRELADIQLPTTINSETEKGKAWIGYYHQKAAYDGTTAGGYRPNSGRPSNDRNIMLNVRITREAADKLNAITHNKSEFIDRLIKDYQP